MRVWAKLAISLGIGTLSLLLSLSSGLFEDVELRVSDLWLQLRGRQLVPSGVVIVSMDEASYKELNVPYGQPWPRALHARLVRRLKELGAKRVVFDVLFAGPGVDAAADTALAEAMGELPSVVGAEASMRFIQNQGGGYLIEELEEPYELFRRSAVEGLIGLRERKSYIRNFPLPRSDQERRFPFLAQAAAGLRSSELGPGLPGPYDLIRYYGPGRTIPNISYWEVLSDDAKLSSGLLRDATVFVGLLLRSDTGGAQKDSYLSPLGPPMIFGLEVHATIFANLSQRSWIMRPSPLLERSCQAAFVAVATFVALSLSPLVFGIVVASAVVAWCLAAFLLIGSGFFLVGACTVLIVLPLLLLGTSLRAYLLARRSEESLRSAFELYVSPEMVPQLQSQGGALTLGGEKLWVTALFTDIQDFTSISEEMPAEKTSEMLNAYFTEVVEVVFRNQGTLLKFIGDAIFAIWGAPIKLANHAELAIKAGRDIRAAVERFNSTQRFPPLITRIGIHTGPMLVGNLGSHKRFDYTAIGDSVNLAARVEGLNKYFGTDILFTEPTRKDTGGFAGAVQIGTVRVKGRREPVRLFSVFDPPLDRGSLAHWEEGLAAFCRAQFSEAERSLTLARDGEPRLRVACELYLNELADLGRTPLPLGWGGELNFESK